LRNFFATDLICCCPTLILAFVVGFFFIEWPSWSQVIPSHPHQSTGGLAGVI
jgi:hypothetical protein